MDEGLLRHADEDENEDADEGEEGDRAMNRSWGSGNGRMAVYGGSGYEDVEKKEDDEDFLRVVHADGEGIGNIDVSGQ